MVEELDIVGNWTEIKLNILEKYAKAYARIMSRQGIIKKYDYIDAFAGAGAVVSKATGKVLPGSSALALEIEPRFSHYHLVEMDKSRAERLRVLASARSDVTVYEGDCNSLIMDEVYSQCRYEDFRRALCVFDPYGLNPRWGVVEMAGKMRSIEIFLSFMLMDANRNVLWSNPDAVKPIQIERMNAFWGDESWREEAYELRQGLFGTMMEKKENIAIIQAYRKRLREKAGFKYVPDPIPMRNMNGVPIYYLFFASHNEKGNKIASSIFNKHGT